MLFLEPAGEVRDSLGAAVGFNLRHWVFAAVDALLEVLGFLPSGPAFPIGE